MHRTSVLNPCNTFKASFCLWPFGDQLKILFDLNHGLVSLHHEITNKYNRNSIIYSVKITCYL